MLQQAAACRGEKVPPLRFAPVGTTGYAERLKADTMAAALARVQAERRKAILLVFTVLHPSGYARIMWNWLMTLLVLFTATYVPVTVAFDLELQMRHHELLVNSRFLELAIDVVFLVDILVNFRTGFIQRGLFVKHPRLIAMRYLRRAFIIDLAGALPLTFIVSAAEGGVPEPSSASRASAALQLCRALKLIRIV